VICKLAAPSTPPDNLDYIAINNKPNDGSVRWGLTLSKGMPCQESGFKSTVVARTSFSKLEKNPLPLFSFRLIPEKACLW